MNTPCCCSCGSDTGGITPVINRPGLTSIAYRIGDYASFFEAMKLRISNLAIDVPQEENDDSGREKILRVTPLRDLRTRSLDDPAMAWLDAWACIADVLTFYQERIANEGYLGTATERRSVLELAHLVGYKLRPGVASTVYLAYTIDQDRTIQPPKPMNVTLPVGARCQSVPGPGELPQSFETSDALETRSTWNNLQVRLTRPQTLRSLYNRNQKDLKLRQPRIYFQGVATGLRANDPLLVEFYNRTRVFRVLEVVPDSTADRTLVRLARFETAGQGDFATLVREDVEEAVAAAEIAFPNSINALVNKQVEKLRALGAPAVDTEGDHLRKQVDNYIVVAQDLIRKTGSEESLFITWMQRVVVALLDSLNAGNGSTPNLTTLGVSVASLSENLTKVATPSPRAAAYLKTGLAGGLDSSSDASLKLVSTFEPGLGELLPQAVANVALTTEFDPALAAYAFRLKASPFGSTALVRTKFDERTRETVVIGEWPIVEWIRANPHEGEFSPGPAREDSGILYLDASYDSVFATTPQIKSWVAIDKSGYVAPTDENGKRIPVQVGPARHDKQTMTIATIKKATAGLTRADYGLNIKTTRLEVDPPWLEIKRGKPPGSDKLVQDLYDGDFQPLRKLVVYAQSERLKLAEEVIEEDISSGSLIELDGLYDGLKPGRWLIISGEKVVPGTTGIRGSELVMLAGVEHRTDPTLDNDKVHTFLKLDQSLAYSYKRSSVVIYGNVAKASHGETRNEVVGGGDAGKTLQQFSLRQPPLTFVAASNASGADSTLVVRVDNVQWHEADSLVSLSPSDRQYITQTGEDGVTQLIFGTGEHGARLPTGTENVKAVYRNGIGKSGNVKAGQIILVATRVLGIKDVVNPLPASGGADADSRDQGRENAPLAVTALDRLVSTQDYADFARTFAGIGKAAAAELSDGRRQVMHLTIAGADDVPIETTSDLYRNLRAALLENGDPYLALQIDLRELVTLVLSAKIKVLSDYLWEAVEPKVRLVLLHAFGFQRRKLGQSVYLSELVSVIQAVEGVEYVDVDVLSSLTKTEVTTPGQLEKKWADLTKSGQRPAEYVRVYPAESAARALEHRSTSVERNGIYPAQLAIFTPENPATLVLNLV